MRKEIRTTEALRRERENELTQLSMGKWCTLPHTNQASVISHLMTFAAPTVLPTLERDLVPKVSNCFSAKTELGNTGHQRERERCCNKSAMLKSQRAHTHTHTHTHTHIHTQAGCASAHGLCRDRAHTRISHMYKANKSPDIWTFKFKVFEYYM